MLKQKRGESQQLNFFIIYFIFAVLILVAMMYFVHNSLTVEGYKSKILAKEVILLIDFAKPGTEISVNTEGFDVSIDYSLKEVVVKSKKRANSYSYQYFNSNTIEISKDDKITKIKIS
jgi:hypothetical protein